MERILLFVFAVAAAGSAIAGTVALSAGGRAGWLYFLAALCLIVLVARSWRRLSASLRARAGGVPRRPDAEKAHGARTGGRRDHDEPA